MKIYCIAIFPPFDPEKPQQDSTPTLAATLYNPNDKLEVDYKKLIIEDIKPIADLAHGREDTYKAPLADSYFYAKILKNKIIIFASNHPIAPKELKELLDKMEKAKNHSDLKQIIKDACPEELTKIEKIQEVANETKEIMQINIQKLLLNLEKEKEILNKTEELQAAASDFNKKATKLKRSYECFGFFSGFVQDWIVTPILNKAGYEPISKKRP